jgi:hypothetical protein
MRLRISAFIPCLLSLIIGADAVAPQPALAAQAPRPAVQLLVGATLIDGTGAPAVPNAWIRVEGDRITAVGQAAPPAVRGARVLDLAGKSIAPGLSDMHVHLGNVEQARWMLKLLLAHGVTNVKETGNTLGNLAAIRRWMEGPDALPHLYLSGATINGSSEELRFLKEGPFTRSLLENNLAFGVDFLKIHNWISSEGLKQIAGFAAKNNLYLTGHVPLSMTSIAAIDGGMTILEHVRMHASEFLDAPQLIARYQLDFIVMRRTGAWAHFDSNGVTLKRTLDALEERKDRFFIDPTLVVQWALAHGDSPAVTEAPEVQRVSPALLDRWKKTAKQYGDLNAEEYAEAKGSVRGMAAFAALLHARGIRVLTGTDTAVNWVVPGHSLHQELELLVEGGLSPVAAIHCSTGRASEALRRPDRGTVAPGQRADLIIVGGDLAADIRKLRQLEQVMLGGRLFDRAKLLEEAAQLAAADLPAPQGGTAAR